MKIAKGYLQRLRSLTLWLSILLTAGNAVAAAPLTCSELFGQEIHRKPIKGFWWTTYERNALRQMRPPAVDAEQLRQETADIWSNAGLSLDEKTLQTFEVYSRLRLSAMPSGRAELAKNALDNIKTNGKSYGSYTPKTGIIEISKKAEIISFFSTVSHELEHLDQLGHGSIPGTVSQAYIKAQLNFLDIVRLALSPVQVAPNSMAMKRLLIIEPEAIGAQWDFLQAIPPEARLAAVTKIMNDPNLPARFKKMLIADLKAADLGRSEYIKKVAYLHGYSFLNPDTVLNPLVIASDIATSAISIASYGLVALIPYFELHRILH